MEDIKDSEIRIIGKDETFDKNTVPVNPSVESSKGDSVLEKKIFDREEGRYNKPKDGWSIRKLLILFVLFVIVANVLFYIFKGSMSQPPVEARMNGVEELENAMFDPEVPEGQFESEVSAANTMILDDIPVTSSTSAFPHCQEKMVEINGIELKLMIPMDAVPKFVVGKIDPNDANIVLALQAADIRKDNGEIVGACVYNGEVVGKGLAKKGYVSIIQGKMRIGVTDHSPLFEAKAVRRAICQRGSSFFVAESLTPESFHDFAQALQDLNIDNAVYLVGSQYALGFLRDINSKLHEWGESKFAKAKNISYLVWKKE